MSTTNWASLIVAIIAIVSSFAGAIRWLVKHYLNELKPNGGGSIKDKVNQLEVKVDILTDMMKEVIGK